MAKTIADVANIKMINGVPIELTDVEKQEIVDDWNSPDNIISYGEKRQSEYPSLGDQIDMIYKDMKNSTTTHAAAVEAVKTKWPKDNSGPV